MHDWCETNSVSQFGGSKFVLKRENCVRTQNFIRTTEIKIGIAASDKKKKKQGRPTETLI